MRKLAWLCGGFCGAIFLAHYALPPKVLLVFSMLAAVLSVGAGMTGKEQLRRAVLCCFGAALGFSWYALSLRQIAPLADIPWEEQTVTACVTEYPKIYDDAVSLTVRLTSEPFSGLTARLSDYDRTSADLRPGDLITVAVKMRTGAIRYGEETDAYLAKGISMSGYLRAAPEKTGVWRGRWILFPQELSHALVARADAVFPADVSAFAKALMLGEKQELYRENLDIPLRDAGIMHAVAVSGMHLAFLLGFFRLVGGNGRRGALLAIPAMLVFALMAGASPSILRAVIMASLFLIAPAFEREADPPTSFFCALAVLLAFNPFSAGSVSLQLSFGALAGILLVTQNMSERWSKAVRFPKEKRYVPLRKVWRYLAVTFATTVGAMLFTIPLSALHFGTVALAAPITNLLILWLLPAAFIGCYVAALLSFAVPVLGTAAGWVIAWALRYVLLIAKTLGGVRALRLSTGDPRIVVWLVVVYLIFFLAWRLRRFGKWKYLAATGISVALLVLAVSLTRAESLRTPRVVALDVGQGQSLVLCDGDQTVMIDCGGGAKDTGAGDIAAQYLCAAQRDRVDTLFLTHPHEDHINGVVRLMLQVPVDRIVVPASADPERPEFHEVLCAAQERGVEIIRVADDTSFTFGDLHVQVFSEIGRDTEDGCMLLRCSRGDFDALITGDVPDSVEKDLVAQTDLSGTELYIVGHHGSAFSSGDALLDALQAETAIVSCGYNSFGHPNEDTLSRLRAHQITVYRTDQDGTVTVRME